MLPEVQKKNIQTCTEGNRSDCHSKCNKSLSSHYPT